MGSRSGRGPRGFAVSRVVVAGGRPRRGRSRPSTPSGFDADLLGYLDIDRQAARVTRFDAVALGDHWGEGPYTRGARPGRSPLGVAFMRVDGSDPADRIAPQASRYLPGYLNP